MTLPPQGPYGSQPSEGGGPQWGGPPPQGPGAQQPYGGGPAGHPQGGPQDGQPGAPWPQQPWVGGPRPSNTGGGKGKWILIGLALVAVIAVSVVGTVLVLRPDSGGGNGQSNTANGASEFASANDTGPANIITEDPTCEAWGKISDGLEVAAPGWNDQDYSVPATEWTPEQRTAFEKKSAALASAIPNVNNIAKQTPHRVMRELYGQYIAYSQAVIDAIPTYSSTDKNVVAASNRLAGALNRVCDAIYFRAAQQTAPLIQSASAPTDVQMLDGDRKLTTERFVSSQDGICNEWVSSAERFDSDTAPWRKLNIKVSATEWTPEQSSVMDSVVPIMQAYADDMERLGRESGNLVFEDFAVLAAQYLRAYTQGVPTFTPNITYMSSVAVLISNSVYWACKAVT